jgi:hypothetical protein
MASKAETRVVNLAGLVQGITLVTFPAASSVFTDATEYDLSNTQNGAMLRPAWPCSRSRSRETSLRRGDYIRSLPASASRPPWDRR